MVVENKCRFKVGDRVFAKLKGSPYWPATVQDIDSSSKIARYNVLFYGDNKLGIKMKDTDICSFSENKSRIFQQNQRNKKFSVAMKEAESSFNKSLASKTLTTSPVSNSIAENSTPLFTSSCLETPFAVSSPLVVNNEEMHIKMKEIPGREIISEQLLESRWVTDDTFQIYFDILNDRIVKEDVYFLNPSIAQAVKSLEDIDYLLQPLGLKDKSVVFIPVSDCPDFQNWSVEGGTGTHWSLLLYVKSQNTFYYFDSLGESNFEHAHTIKKKMVRVLGTKNESPIIQIQTPQQTNSVDCGIYTLLVIDAIVLNILNNRADLTTQGLTGIMPTIADSDVLVKRALLALLIHKNQHATIERNTLKLLMFNSNIAVENKILKEEKANLLHKNYELKKELKQRKSKLDSAKNINLEDRSSTDQTPPIDAIMTNLNSDEGQSDTHKWVPVSYRSRNKLSPIQDSQVPQIQLQNKYHLLDHTGQEECVGDSQFDSDILYNKSEAIPKKSSNYGNCVQSQNANKTKFRRKIKVSLYSDSQGRGVSQLITEASKDKIHCEGQVMPNAHLDYVTKTALSTSSGDVIVIVGGTNDILNDNTASLYQTWEHKLATLSKIKPVIITTVPKRFDCHWKNHKVHSQVLKANRFIREVTSRHVNVHLVDISNLKRFHYTYRGLHLNKKGKSRLASQINKRLTNICNLGKNDVQMDFKNKSIENQIRPHYSVQSVRDFPPLKVHQKANSSIRDFPLNSIMDMEYRTI